MKRLTTNPSFSSHTINARLSHLGDLAKASMIYELLVVGALAVGAASFLFALPLTILVAILVILTAAVAGFCGWARRWVYGAESTSMTKQVKALGIHGHATAKGILAPERVRVPFRASSQTSGGFTPRPIILPPKATMRRRALVMRRPHHAHSHSS